jgi:hypothetical protein
MGAPNGTIVTIETIGTVPKVPAVPIVANEMDQNK